MIKIKGCATKRQGPEKGPVAQRPGSPQPESFSDTETSLKEASGPDEGEGPVAYMDIDGTVPPPPNQTESMSVWAKSLPLNNSGSPVVSASAYAKQSPKFSAAG